MNKIPTYRVHSEPYKPPVEKLARDIAILRKRYGRGLGRFPTKDELAAMRRAASLTVISDYAMADPAASANDIVRLVNAAARARSTMEAMLGKKPPVHRDDFDIDVMRMAQT